MLRSPTPSFHLLFASFACLLLGTAHGQGVPGAAASWSFNGGTGADDIGTHDAIEFGVVPATDRFGQPDHAFLSAGDPEYMEVPYDMLFTPGDSSFTYSLWFNAEVQDSASTGALLDWYRCGAAPVCAPGDGAMVYVALDSLGRVVFLVRDDLDTQLTTLSDTLQDLHDGEWHHVVAMLDRNSDLASLYLDGQLADTDTGVLEALEDGGVEIPLSFGRRFRQGWAVPTQYYQGALDDISYFQRALTPAEVLQLYSFGVGLPDGGASTPVFSAHPNPTDGMLHVQVNDAGDVYLEVSTLDGRTVHQQRLKAAAAGSLFVDLGAEPAGTYLLRVAISNGRTATTRITVF